VNAELRTCSENRRLIRHFPGEAFTPGSGAACADPATRPVTWRGACWVVFGYSVLYVLFFSPVVFSGFLMATNCTFPILPMPGPYGTRCWDAAIRAWAIPNAGPGILPPFSLVGWRGGTGWCSGPTFYQTFKNKLNATSVPYDLVDDFVPELLRNPDLNLQYLAAKNPSEVAGFEDIVGESQAIRLAVGRAQRAAPNLRRRWLLELLSSPISQRMRFLRPSALSSATRP
jgi:hypothetical protein